jgi:hypothetical protein
MSDGRAALSREQLCKLSLHLYPTKDSRLILPLAGFSFSGGLAAALPKTEHGKH